MVSFINLTQSRITGARHLIVPKRDCLNRVWSVGMLVGDFMDYVNWSGKIHPLWVTSIPSQGIWGSKKKWRKWVVRGRKWASICRSIALCSPLLMWYDQLLMLLLPWLPHNGGLQSGIMPHINPFFLKSLLSRSFTTATRNQTNILGTSLMSSF